MEREHFIKTILLGSTVLIGRKNSSVVAGINTLIPVCGHTDFVHPGILHSKDDLRRIKYYVEHRIWPPIDSYKILKNLPTASPDYNIQGPFPYIARDGVNRYTKTHVENDYNAAYQNALMWVITGDKAHAQKAVEIINAYANTLKGITGSNDNALTASLCGFIFVNAAEIMRYTYTDWRKDDIANCEKMFRDVFCKGLEESFFSRKAYTNGNWGAAAIKAVMGFGVFLNDKAIYQKGVDLYYSKNKDNGSLDNYIINDTGQCQESGRDQQHVMLGLGNLAEACEIGFHQGLDMFGAMNNRLLKGYEYTAKYNLGQEVPFVQWQDVTGKYSHWSVISPKTRGRFRPVFEIAYNYFVNRKGLSMPWTERVLQKTRPEGIPPNADHPGFGSLLFYTKKLGNATFALLSNGVDLQNEQGRLRVIFVRPDVIRVRYTKEDEFQGNGTIVCIEQPEMKITFKARQEGHKLLLLSDSLKVWVDLRNLSIEYRDRVSNRLLLSERETDPREGELVYIEKVTYDQSTMHTVKTADGVKEEMDVLRRDKSGHSWKYRNYFQWADGEAIYGLGSHMVDYLNWRGKELYLCQHNLKAMVPVLNSTAGYGLLFDAGCGMLYKDKEGSSFIELEAAKEIDYYFMKGSTMDEVIGQYRSLTGECPMMPRYIFGYIQSRERYKSSEELINIVAEYRKRNVPLDVIVQDWNYWPKGSWGYMKMDPAYYPDPAKLAESIHSMNAKLMISIWPNPSNCPQAADFKAKGFMLERSVYDAFNPLARKLYWEYANNEFFKNGFDAWWCDCTEPLDADWKKMPDDYGWDSYRERWDKNLKLLDDELGAERSGLFSLYDSKGIYENQRATSERKRVVNLTRSCYAGQQRYSTITWNGDTHASWKSFAREIPAGLNFMAAGCPYWTVDIGAFFTKRKKQLWFCNGDYDQGVDDLGYREFYTRMFQFAVFLPIFRSHGTDTPREIWNFGKPGEPFYDALLKMIQLRYQLLPYIYSLVAMVTREHYTITRLLAFDFPDDTNVHDIKNQFMFGPAFLVCAVTKPMYYDSGSVVLNGIEKKQTVYLPKGANWFDFWTGRFYKGGQNIVADAPLDKIPLYVRQGAIVPTGPVIQHSEELSGKELTITIYPGKDASFTLYEDEGNNYNYEHSAFSTIELNWKDKKNTLTVRKRKGGFPGMEKERAMRFVLKNGTRSLEKAIRYSGQRVSIKF